MGTDFFDGLGETLTRTARELGERAEQIYETQRIRNKISAEERIVDKLMADMGNLLYRRYKSQEAIDKELVTFCEEIDQHFLKIKEYKENVADMRGKKVCPACGKAVDKEVSFCPYCGAACPNSVKTDAANAADEMQEEETQDCAKNQCPVEEPECDEPQEEPDCGSGSVQEESGKDVEKEPE